MPVVKRKKDLQGASFPHKVRRGKPKQADGRRGEDDAVRKLAAVGKPFEGKGMRRVMEMGLILPALSNKKR